MLGKNIEQINHARLAGKEGLWRITVKNNQIAAIEPQPQAARPTVSTPVCGIFLHSVPSKRLRRG